MRKDLLEQLQDVRLKRKKMLSDYEKESKIELIVISIIAIIGFGLLIWLC